MPFHSEMRSMMKPTLSLLYLLVLANWAIASKQCKLTEKEVLCADNDLVNVPKQLNPKQYEVLNLAGNDLDELFKVDVYEFSNLKYLHLNYNAINYIEDDTFEDLKKLEFLDLSKNILEEVPDTMIVSNAALRTLDLSMNMFNVRTPALSSKSLEVLNLAKSKISYFGEENLEDLPNLRFLNLESNNLVHLDAKIFKIPYKFTRLNVDYNMWECNCDTIELFKELTDSKLINLQKTIACSKGKSFYKIYDKNGPVSKEAYCQKILEVEEPIATTIFPNSESDSHTINYDKITNGIKSLEKILKMEKMYFQDLRKEKDILDSVALLTIKILIFVIFISGIALGILISTIMNRRIKRIKSRAILRSESFT